jgi:hypothetical protein
MIITDTQRKFKIAPAGAHLARLFSVIDLGHQSTDWKGVPKIMHKVVFSWELHGNDNDDKPLTTDDGKPLIVSKRYTVLLSDQARLRQDLEAWFNKKMTPEDRRKFDLKNLLGKFCMLNITHTEDGEYANVNGISPVPSALRNAQPEGVNPTKIFWLQDYKQEEFDSLSNYYQEKIKESSEWRGQQEREKNAPKIVDDEIGDIPF